MSVIKDYRKKRKFTQSAFAKEMNVSLATVKRWEVKQYAPTIVQASRICNLLRLPFKKLFEDYKEVE